jgi:hypothetical protein
MLVLVGTLRAAATLGGGTNKKTGEVIPLREVLQIETKDNRGLVEVKTITVPDSKPFQSQLGKEVKLPVRAWATGAPVNFVYEPVQQAA